MKNIFIAVLTLFFTAGGTLFALTAEHSTYFGADGAVYIDNNKGYGVESGEFTPISYTPIKVPDGYTLPGNDPGRNLGNGWGGVKAVAYLSHKIKVPFLKGTGALTKDNNILFDFKGSLSPVSGHLLASVTLTPIAFLNFQAGTDIGTGWDFFGVFSGLGLNNDGTGNAFTTSFPGVVLKSWVSGTFQFDLGAIVPGQWTHVLLLAKGKLQHQYFTAAGKDDPWQFEMDDGENFNGFKYLGTYFLGYSLPFKVNTAGFLVDTEENLFENRERSTMETGGWGSDFVKVTFGPLVNITLSEDSSLAVLAQFTKERNYTQDTIFNNYFQNRVYSSWYIQFQRVAVSYSHKL